MTKEIIPPCRARNLLAQIGAPIDFNYYATANFSWQELLTKQKEIPTLEVLENLLKIAIVLQKYRNTIFKNSPITITSGWRSPEYNRKIGGATNSYHTKGLALDFVVNGMSPQTVQTVLDHVHFGGMEFAPTWTHIDLRGHKARFKA